MRACSLQSDLGQTLFHFWQGSFEPSSPIASLAYLEFAQGLISALRVNPDRSTQLQYRDRFPSNPVLNGPAADAATDRIFRDRHQPALGRNARFVTDILWCLSGHDNSAQL